MKKLFKKAKIMKAFTKEEVKIDSPKKTEESYQ